MNNPHSQDKTMERAIQKGKITKRTALNSILVGMQEETRRRLLNNLPITEDSLTSEILNDKALMKNLALLEITEEIVISLAKPFLQEVAQQEIINNSTPVATPKVGRNQPCPCGSGKKYKRCCGK